MEDNTRLPKMWQALLVLVGFLALAFGFTAGGIEIQLALLAGWFLALGVGRMTGYTYKEMQDFIIQGINNGMEAVLILVVVGALIGTWISGGVVPTLIYYGLMIISPSIFLFATLIITSIVSLATGTSWGSVGTAGIAMMGIGAGLGVPPEITAGAVISGAYVGDKLSPLSDSTVLSASMSKVDLIDHVKGMLPVSIPAWAIAAIAYLIAGFILVDGAADLSQVDVVMNGISGVFDITILSLIPMLVVIILLAKGFPSIPVISLGAALGIICGIFIQGLDPLVSISTAWAQIPPETGVEFLDNILSRGGIDSMLGSIAIILFGLGFAGVLEGTGILRVLGNSLDRFITSVGNLNVVTLVVGFFGQLFGSVMYVSNILTPTIMGEKYDDLKVDRRVLSRNTEVSGTLVSGMIPWTDNGIYLATVLGMSTFDYLPYMWFAFAAIIISIIYGYTGKFMWRTDSETNESK